MTRDVIAALRAPATFVGELDTKEPEATATTSAAGTAIRGRDDTDVRKLDDPIHLSLSNSRPKVSQFVKNKKKRHREIVDGRLPAATVRRGRRTDQDREVVFTVPGWMLDDELCPSDCAARVVCNPHEFFDFLGELVADDQVETLRTWFERRGEGHDPSPNPDGAGVEESALQPTKTDMRRWPEELLDWLTLAAGFVAIGLLVTRFQPGPIWFVGARAAAALSVAVIVVAGLLAIRWWRSQATTLDPESWRVVIDCPVPVAGGTTHAVVFDEPSANERNVFGPAASRSDIAAVADRHKYLSADDAVDRINRQAQMILAGQAVFVLFLGGVVWRVTTSESGAATGINDVGNLVRNNALEYSLAIAALAASFSMAFLAQGFGSVGSVNLRNHWAAAAAFNHLIATRSSLAQNAAVMFGISLLLAVAVPIAAASRLKTAVEITPPTWTVADGLWIGESNVKFQDLADGERLDVTVWSQNGSNAVLLAGWDGVQPDESEEPGSITIPLKFEAEPGSTVVVNALVGDEEIQLASDKPVDCDANSADAIRPLACATFLVPTPPRRNPTLEAEWTETDNGLFTLGLTVTGGNLGGGEATWFRVGTRPPNADQVTGVHSAMVAASPSGGMNSSSSFIVDPRKDRHVRAVLGPESCSLQSAESTGDCSVYEFAVPVEADVDVPVISLTGIEGPLVGTVEVPVMPLDRHLRVTILGGKEGAEDVLYSTVAGRSRSVGRVVAFSVPLMVHAERVVIDAQLTEDGATYDETRCLGPSPQAGCLIVRLD